MEASKEECDSSLVVNQSLIFLILCMIPLKT